MHAAGLDFGRPRWRYKEGPACASPGGMDLFVDSMAGSFLERPVVDVNILEGAGLVRKNDPADAGVDDYPFAEQAGNDL